MAKSVSPWQPMAHGPTSRRKGWRDERMDGDDVDGGVKKRNEERRKNRRRRRIKRQ